MQWCAMQVSLEALHRRVGSTVKGNPFDGSEMRWTLNTLNSFLMRISCLTASLALDPLKW